MSAKEYYLEKYGIDISRLPRVVCNAIACSFLEHLYSPKEELLEYFKEYGIEAEESAVEERESKDLLQKALDQRLISADVLEKAWKKEPIGTVTTHKDGTKWRKR